MGFIPQPILKRFTGSPDLRFPVSSPRTEGTLCPLRYLARRSLPVTDGLVKTAALCVDARAV
jgi:hypothetical protein